LLPQPGNQPAFQPAECTAIGPCTARTDPRAALHCLAHLLGRQGPCLLQHVGHWPLFNQCEIVTLITWGKLWLPAWILKWWSKWYCADHRWRPFLPLHLLPSTWAAEPAAVSLSAPVHFAGGLINAPGVLPTLGRLCVLAVARVGRWRPV